MSFFGKTYIRVKAENLAELMDALKITEELRTALKNSFRNSKSTFMKNDDGTLQYKVTSDDKTIQDLKFPLGSEFEMPLPDKSTGKATFTLEGDTLKGKIVLADGKHIHIDRYFEGNNMKTEIYGDDTVKGIIYSEAV